MQRFYIAPFLALSIGITMPITLDAKDGNNFERKGVVVETLIKSSKQWNGQVLPNYPNTAPEITVLRITIPPGITLPIHNHPVINTAVILKGELEVILPKGKKRVFKEGEALIEVVDQVHYGRSLGDKPVVIIVFYAGSEGLTTTILE
tara:strand:- start:2048 stop:2491 length:444 start_codon:yes stop_codon:yes gene_type:complete